MLCVGEQDSNIRFFDFFPGALDADAFDFVHRLVQAGGIDHMQWHTFDLQMRTHDVACCARHRRDDGKVFTRQCIEQRGLSHVGLADQHDG